MNDPTVYTDSNGTEENEHRRNLLNNNNGLDDDDENDSGDATDDEGRSYRMNEMGGSSQRRNSEFNGNSILLSLKLSEELASDSPFIPKDKLDDTIDHRLNHKHGDDDHNDGCRKREPYSPIEKVQNNFVLSNYDSIPPYLQGNEFVQTGYRVNFSYKLCLISIFKLHNETLNIWTHLFGTILFFILMIVTQTSILENPQPIDKFVFTIFFLCAIAQMLFSTIFHTFCSVSGRSYVWFARLDYTGISLMIVGSHYPPLYYLLKCHPTVAGLYIGGISLLGVVGVSVSMLPFFQTYRFRTFRATFFVLFGLFILVPLPHIWVLEGFMYVWPILWRLGVMGSIYIAGATIYASRCPECCLPGKFDLGFSSHPIWHLFTIVAAVVQLYNCIFSYNHYGNTCPVM